MAYSRRIYALTSSDIWLMAIAVELKCNPFALGGHSMKYPFYSEFIKHMKMFFLRLLLFELVKSEMLIT